MGIIIKKAIKRKKGYLYIIDLEGNICMDIMSRKPNKKEKIKFRYELIMARDYFVENSRFITKTK